uniref:DUF2153 domain-containing protein n=1 Tax=Thermofilum pendens TaxID=2269 RepID=A0A7C4BAC1_THEPE
MASEDFIKLFAANLTNWVEAQKNFLNSASIIEKELEKADRLELVLATRAAFAHIVKTVEAFDKWLQDPFIVGHMPREMLVEIQKSVWEILKKLLELDIKHTSEFRDLILRLADSGKLHPLLFIPRERVEREDRFSISY